MQTRRLGRTGHHSSLAILGGAAFAMDTPDGAAGFLHEAVDAGINHLDIAPGYRQIFYFIISPLKSRRGFSLILGPK